MSHYLFTNALFHDYLFEVPFVTAWPVVLCTWLEMVGFISWKFWIELEHIVPSLEA